ncbi:MAG TPA: hypothetical protein VEO01_26815 [Pseudonocardiaceae bacterium]|nr:hypothetical protein [Pseudonocardiaceae bacterium]
MRFPRRPEPPAPEPVTDDADTLRTRLAECCRYINSNAGRVPAGPVLVALTICDLLRRVVDTAPDESLDVYTALSVERMVTDYLPTTLRTFLAVRSATPVALLREQLDALLAAASAIELTAQQRDTDAMRTQGAFLRTKFTRSDLDL